MRKIISYSLLFLFFLNCYSCTSTYKRLDIEEKHIFNTLTGGVTGALLQGSAGGFVLGAFVSDVISYTYIKIKYNNHQIGSRDNAIKRYVERHTHAQLFLEDASVNIKKDDSVSSIKANVVYTVLGPENIQEMQIKERRVLFAVHKRIDIDDRLIKLPQGTFISEIEFTLPKQIQKGTYTLLTTISDGKNIKRVETKIDIT